MSNLFLERENLAQVQEKDQTVTHLHLHSDKPTHAIELQKLSLFVTTQCWVFRQTNLHLPQGNNLSVWLHFNLGFLISFFLNQTRSLCFTPIKVWGSLAMGKAHSNPNNRKILTKYLKLLVGQGRVMTCTCKKKNNKQTNNKTQPKKPTKPKPKALFLPLWAETLSVCLDFLQAWTEPCWFFWYSWPREVHRY